MTGKIAKPAGSTGNGPTRLGALLFVCLLCLLATSSASAAPAWLPATDLSAPNKDAVNSAVAMDDAGDTVAVWELQGINHNVQASTRNAGGSFSSPVDLSTASTDQQVVMTPGGEAVAAWVHFVNPNSTIQVATRAPGGSFSAPVDVATTVPGSNPQDLHLAVNAAGGVVVTWVQKDPTSPDPDQFSVWASVRPAGGGFTAPAIVSPLPLVVGNDASRPRVAIDDGGDATVVWMYFDGTDDVIQTATAPAGAGFTAPNVLSTATTDGIAPDVAVDSAGDTVAVWEAFDVTDPGPPPVTTTGRIQAATRSSGGSFSTPMDLSDSSQTASAPQIEMTPSGDATAVWTRSNGSYSIIQASTGALGGAFSMPVDLSAVGQNALDPELAVNAAGDAAVVWHRSNGLNGIAQGSTRPAGGSFTPAVDLSASGQDAAFPQVAVDSAGDATTVWWRSNGTNNIVQAAGYDAEPPQLRDVSIPASGMVGVPASFSANPFDVWPIASTAFSFGDGGTAGGTSVTHTYLARGAYPVTVTAVDAAGTPVSASGTIAIAPSNRFSVGKLKLNRKKGSGTIEVDVPGPGKLILSGKVVKKTTKGAKKAGKFKLAITPRGKTLKKLNRAGKAKVKLSIAFTPDGGSSATTHKTVTLIKKLKR